MAGAGITISITAVFNENELKQEIANWGVTDLNPALESANSAVAASAKEALKNSIESQVYAKWSPKEYIRTGGLIRGGAINASAGPALMVLEHFPSGGSEQWEHPVSNDALIARIESGSGYEWRRHPGPRPYWKKFVDEMIDGEFAAVFDSSMAAFFGGDYVGGTTVEREAGDGEY